MISLAFQPARRVIVDRRSTFELASGRPSIPRGVPRVLGLCLFPCCRDRSRSRAPAGVAEQSGGEGELRHSRLSALGSRLSALGSRLSALGSRLSALGSRLSALGSRLSALGSRLSALGSRLSALGSRLSALGSRLSALGSRLSALMMLSPDRIAFVKPFFEVFIIFLPRCRSGQVTARRPHRKTSFGPRGPGRSGALKRLVFLCLCPLSVGSVKALAAVFSGALLAVFKSVWRQSSNRNTFGVFFDHSLVILLVTK